MIKYYYKTLIFAPKGAFGMTMPIDTIEEELNRLGDLGWELVSTTSVPNTSNLVIIMKNVQLPQS